MGSDKHIGSTSYQYKQKGVENSEKYQKGELIIKNYIKKTTVEP